MGSGTALDAVEELVEPEDLGAALDAEPDARANWDGFPGSTKRAILEWIIAAKRPPTRASRVAETARLAAQGIRANQWRQQVAPSLNFPIRLQGNGDGAPQHPAKCEHGGAAAAWFLRCARMHARVRRAGQASLA
jgi:hypothetical protein